MKTMLAGIILCSAAQGGCSQKEAKIEPPPAPVVAVKNPSPPAIPSASAAPAFVPPAADPANEAEPTLLAKVGDTLYVGGASGLLGHAGGATRRVLNGSVTALHAWDGQLWVAQEGRLATLDGSCQIVPEFASSMSALAAFAGELYVGTRGDGVWAQKGDRLEVASPPWNVLALAAADFGLFAATSDGLWSSDGERWRRRHLDDRDDDLSSASALYFRYPYLYVGAGSMLLRYDGGRWETFALDPGVSIAALGWHNGRLYIGALDGSLRTLEGSVLETVAPDAPGAVTSILRFDGRLHVGSGGGAFRLRYGRFERLMAEPAAGDLDDGSIASLL